MELIDSLQADITALVVVRKEEMCLLALQLQHENRLTYDRLLAQYYTALSSYVNAKLRLHRERKRNSDTNISTLVQQVQEYKQRKNEIRDELIAIGIDPETYKAMNVKIQKRLK